MKQLSVISYRLSIVIIGCLVMLHCLYGLTQASSSLQPSIGYAISDEEIQGAVMEYLYKTFPMEKDNMTVEYIEVKANNIVLPKKGISPVVVLPKGYKIPGKINLMVNYQDKEWNKTVWVSAKVVQTKDVVLATRVLPMNHVIEAGDVRLEKVNVQDITGSIFFDVNMLLGMKIKRPITANAQIREDYVYKPAVIKKGETVDVVVESGAVTITVRCAAREDGFLGKAIRVENMSSGKDISGIVVGTGKVLVRL